MIEPVQAWCIEQRDRRLSFATGHDIAVFAETRAAAVTWHNHPAWKVVLPVGGHTVVGRTTGAGVLVPPQFAHTCATSSPFVAIFIEPWCVPPCLGLSWLDPTTVRRLLAALGEELDLAAVQQELTAVTGPAPAVDPRVLHALRGCGQARRIDTLSVELGLSPPRLRTLVRAAVGIPLSRMRQWQRLRAAVTALSNTPLAEAAVTTGFADQAHLTRTARRMLGRRPASLRPSRAADRIDGVVSLPWAQNPL